MKRLDIKHLFVQFLSSYNSIKGSACAVVVVWRLFVIETD